MKMIDFHNLPAAFIAAVTFGSVAIIGGIARYLNGYINGVPFRFAAFMASAFVSGFTGYMLALVGLAMNFPEPMLFIMAGTGGFLGDQAMKFIMEFISGKVGMTPPPAI